MAVEEFDLIVNSLRLHGQRFGSPIAPLVLGLHGLMGTMRSFDFLGEQLGGDALQLVALDLRGRGRSETTPTGTYGWENHALDVLAVADALDHQSFALIGRSMGASVAMKVVELERTRLDAVVLVDVAGRVDREADPDAVAEDRAYTATQDPYDRWSHLTMPALLLRAERELRPGVGHHPCFSGHRELILGLTTALSGCGT